MANPDPGKSLCSYWFFLGQDFAVRTVSMETVQYVYFCFEEKPANSTFATKPAKKKCENGHSSHWNYQQKLKRLNFFRNFKDGWRRRTFFKCKPPEVHFTIRNRVPYNKLLTNRACSGRTREYWPSVVFVRLDVNDFFIIRFSSKGFANISVRCNLDVLCVFEAFDQGGASRVDLRRELYGKRQVRFALWRCHRTILVLPGSS